MTPQLSAIVDDLEAVEQRVRVLHRSLPRDAWLHRPGPARWSPAECIAHLNMTSTAALPVMRAGLHEAAKGEKWQTSSGTYQRDVKRAAGWLAREIGVVGLSDLQQVQLIRTTRRRA